MIKNYISIKTKDLKKQIDYLKNQITELETQSIEPKWYEYSLTNVEDRKLILDYFYEKLSHKEFHDTVANIYALFLHVDNIRYVCKCNNIECPTWFVEKYLN